MHFTFCPHCGNKLIDREIGDEGMIPYCEVCHVPLWDMFTTCIICAVANKFDEIALIRQQYVSTTTHCCIAGIIQLGENAEDTVLREIKEEIGLVVRNIQYIRSYFYDKKNMLMLGIGQMLRKMILLFQRKLILQSGYHYLRHYRNLEKKASHGN